MLDLTAETPLSLEAAARLVPPARGGKRCHISTILRWILDGSRAPDGSRVRLEAVRLGGKWVTSAPALQRFAERLTPRPADAPPLPSLRTPGQRRRAAERAGAELQKLGL